MTEFDLHVFEMAYLMSLMRVESVAALPDAVLFPKDPQVRAKVLADGQRRLTANGWLTPAAAPAQASYNEDLLSMAAAVADPRFSILARRETSRGERADATMYFNNVEVVEVVQTQREGFRLRRLADAAEAFRRVRKMLGVTPHAPHAGAAADLRIEAFERVRRHAGADEPLEAAEDLLCVGMAPDAAHDLVAALASPERKGVVSVLKHVAQKVTDVRVLGFYLRDSGAWLTSVVSESSRQVRVEAVGADDFVRRLVDRVASVCG